MAADAHMKMERVNHITRKDKSLGDISQGFFFYNHETKGAGER